MANPSGSIESIQSESQKSLLDSYSGTNIILDGNSLSFADVEPIAHGATISISKESLVRVRASRALVEKAASGETPVYAVNTGFGHFANKKIPEADLNQLQRNILTSHSGGIGEYLSEQETRLALALRLNVLLKGYTGVREELCSALRDLIHSGITPLVPKYGSVGASGDLIPLSHLVLPLIGEGDVIYEGEKIPAMEALKKAGLEPYTLGTKEGLSLVNGTQVMLAVGSLALTDSLRLLRLANRITALTLEALNGQPRAYSEGIHRLRNHPGQITVAEQLRDELVGSWTVAKEHKAARVQDPYSVRCAPQVHGASLDALNYAKTALERELNAATDNPLVFTESEDLISGGNFHGQPVAMALDIASIATAEIGNISERRLELLCNPNMSGLPALLARDGGVNSGYMVLQYLSASLVNENKQLATPNVIDSIPGNVGVEDHVSMGMTSARSLREISRNLKAILAAELLAAGQAIDLSERTPGGDGTKKLYETLRAHVPTLGDDRIVSADVEKAILAVDELIHSQ